MRTRKGRTICGIVADYQADSRDGAGSSDFQCAVDRLSHRGPDGRGTVAVGTARLGHRRLAIVDVEGGDQPLRAGDHYLVANGEIYNHQVLRRRLRGPFTTGSDNEVILRLIAEQGCEALPALRGMYAFCLATAAGGFVAARDPVGIKPLYWARRKGTVRFASELRAFDADWLETLEVFPPGHVWTPEQGLRRFASATQLGEEHAGQRSDEADRTRAVRAAIVDAVERRMMADVPVGVFLSGGLDSSIVAAVAAGVALRQERRLLTFAVGTDGSADLQAARRVAEHLGTDHHERVYTAEEAVAVLPHVVERLESYEPSLVRSAVPNYFLAELAARTCKVVLTGEGADELFAGYAYLRDITGESELHRELVATVEGLHNLNLQRCDRMTMAHSLEARVPFLDLDVIALALHLPAGDKRSDDHRMEKHLLRTAFADLLPYDIAWRRKSQFGDGSGACDVLAAHAEAAVTDGQLRAAQAHLVPAPRSKEELVYQQFFRRRFPGAADTRILGRFATA
ncbi:MAG: asparagine synthase B [Actinobacteria bacterium]|nr:asparagine synthase B [Actinomycetota bacterium]